jgi:dienelactone hydrolase
VKPWRLLLLALVAAALASLVVLWPWIDAQRRAVVVLATVVETPVLTWAVKVVTAEPKVEDAVLAGNPATLVHPPGGGPWPAIVFVNGATPEGRRQRDVQRLAQGLARAGFLVLVPDIPGLTRGELTEQTLAATIDVAFAATQRSDVRKGRVGLLGVSVGGSLALLAAEDPLLVGRVTSVAAFAPYATLPSVLRLATTGYYLDEGTLKSYDADPFLALVVARSLIVALPVGIDRSRLYSALAQVQPDTRDPLAPLRAFDDANLAPAGRTVLRLLTNTQPTAFDRLYAALSPALRARFDRLSPLTAASRVDIPVELLTAPKDKYFPVTESRALAAALPDATLTVTPASGTHVIPRPSLSHPIGLLQFNAFAVRALKAARD